MTTALEKAQKRRAAMVASGEPMTNLNPWQRWLKKDTRTAAIHANCWQCMGGSETYAEGAMEAIRECTATAGSAQPCPLYEWRPYK